MKIFNLNLQFRIKSSVDFQRLKLTFKFYLMAETDDTYVRAYLKAKYGGGLLEKRTAALFICFFFFFPKKEKN